MDTNPIAAVLTFAVYWLPLTVGCLYAGGRLAGKWPAMRHLSSTAIAAICIALGTALALYGGWNAYTAPPAYMPNLL